MLLVQHRNFNDNTHRQSGGEERFAAGTDRCQLEYTSDMLPLLEDKLHKRREGNEAVHVHVKQTRENAQPR